MEDNNIISNIFIVDPNELGGIAITGQSSNFKYKENISAFREALNETDYVFSAIIQVYKKNVIENDYPTLGIGFDKSKIKTYNDYLIYVSDISQKLSATTTALNLPINLLVADSRDDFMNNFKTPNSWLVAIKNYTIYSKTKPWWKFW